MSSHVGLALSTLLEMCQLGGKGESKNQKKYQYLLLAVPYASSVILSAVTGWF